MIFYVHSKKIINNAAVLPQTNVTAERFHFWLEWMALTALFHTSPSSFAFQEKSGFGVLRGQSQAGNNSAQERICRYLPGPTRAL